MKLKLRNHLDGWLRLLRHLGGRLTVMLLAGIGQPLEVHELKQELLEQAIALLGRRVAGGVRPAAAAGLAAGPV